MSPTMVGRRKFLQINSLKRFDNLILKKVQLQSLGNLSKIFLFTYGKAAQSVKETHILIFYTNYVSFY